MTQFAPVDREYRIDPPGRIRDKVVLLNFREGLRRRRNPETGELFTEPEIERGTREGTRWWNQAQAIDDFGQSQQRNGIFILDQIRAERASTKWLEDFHAAQRGIKRLPATGGIGPCDQAGVVGTIILGSTTLNEPSAYKAKDAAGKVYQVFQTVTIGSTGTASIIMAAIDKGNETNLSPGEKLTWISKDANMAPTCTVTALFAGGAPVEDDTSLLGRVQSAKAHREGAGNDPQMRAWCRRSTGGIEDAFVYPTAWNAGSTLLAITQKRGKAVGPLGRIPGFSTLLAATVAMTPPASPFVPVPPHVLLAPVQSQPTNFNMKIRTATGTVFGWVDARPFPSYHATTPWVTSVSSATNFVIRAPADAALPVSAPLATLTGDAAPAMMLWDSSISRFVNLPVQSVEDLGGNSYRVILYETPGVTPVVQMPISPTFGRREAVARSMERHFDSFGPGQIINIFGDVRGPRCVRFPFENEERPSSLDSLINTRVLEAIGGGNIGVQLVDGASSPGYPTFSKNGPYMLTMGNVGIFPG